MAIAVRDVLPCLYKIYINIYLPKNVYLYKKIFTRNVYLQIIIIYKKCLFWRNVYLHTYSSVVDKLNEKCEWVAEKCARFSFSLFSADLSLLWNPRDADFLHKFRSLGFDVSEWAEIGIHMYVCMERFKFRQCLETVNAMEKYCFNFTDVIYAVTYIFIFSMAWQIFINLPSNYIPDNK
jgi:hypothetical protein